jgi:very-short-patch-repair endonuclease
LKPNPRATACHFRRIEAFMDAPRTTKDFAKRLRRQMSLPEVLLWRAIKGRKLSGLQFRKQHPLGPYVLDFYCEAQRLAVEVDGGSHSFGDRPRRDDQRDAWLERQGIRTLRLSASLVLSEVDDATRTIMAYVAEEPIDRTRF